MNIYFNYREIVKRRYIYVEKMYIHYFRCKQPTTGCIGLLSIAEHGRCYGIMVRFAEAGWTNNVEGKVD